MWSNGAAEGNKHLTKNIVFVAWREEWEWEDRDLHQVAKEIKRSSEAYFSASFMQQGQTKDRWDRTSANWNVCSQNLMPGNCLLRLLIPKTESLELSLHHWCLRLLRRFRWILIKSWGKLLYWCARLTKEHHQCLQRCQSVERIKGSRSFLQPFLVGCAAWNSVFTHFLWPPHVYYCVACGASIGKCSNASADCVKTGIFHTSSVSDDMGTFVE